MARIPTTQVLTSFLILCDLRDLQSWVSRGKHLTLESENRSPQAEPVYSTVRHRGELGRRVMRKEGPRVRTVSADTLSCSVCWLPRRKMA
jgi:hypothetical protein